MGTFKLSPGRHRRGPFHQLRCTELVPQVSDVARWKVPQHTGSADGRPSRAGPWTLQPTGKGKIIRAFFASRQKLFRTTVAVIQVPQPPFNPKAPASQRRSSCTPPPDEPCSGREKEHKGCCMLST